MKNILALTKIKQSEKIMVDWQTVFVESLPKIFHYFCYKVGEIQSAEDLTAITFEKAWKTRQNFDPQKGQAHAWIVGIAQNVVADHFRRKAVEVPLAYLPEAEQTLSADDDLQRKLEFQSIWNILSQYPKREQELITLKYGAELTNREIARITGLSESNVGTILHRVVDKLRTEWESKNER